MPMRVLAGRNLAARRPAPSTTGWTSQPTIPTDARLAVDAGPVKTLNLELVPRSSRPVGPAAMGWRTGCAPRPGAPQPDSPRSYPPRLPPTNPTLEVRGCLVLGRHGRRPTRPS